MSESSVSESPDNSVQQPSWDILAEHQGIKIDEKFILKLTKGTKNVIKEVKDSCKVLHFSSEWNFKEVLGIIDKLDPSEYPKLFIFIVNLNESDFEAQKATSEPPKKKRRITINIQKLKEALTKFIDRPIILQNTSELENVTKISYKEKAADQFTAIDQQQDGLNDLNPFSSFLSSFFNGKFSNVELEVLNNLQKLNNRSLVLRFLWTLRLKDEFFQIMVLIISSRGTEAEFSAAIDVQFDGNIWILSNRAQQLVTKEYNDPQNNNSAILTAIKAKNMEVVNYLITCWTCFIQQHSFDHQVKVSTTAFETGQLDVLCNLLDIADFPFPKNFKSELINYERLKDIINERAELEVAIKAEKMNIIERFTANKFNLKTVYNTKNNSALMIAGQSKKFSVYNFLKLRDYRTTNPNENHYNYEKDSEAQQRKQNIDKGLMDDDSSVNLLCNKSIIHNNEISKDQEKEYRQMIRSWYKDIKLIPNGSIFLNVAASCNRLKIIFDFKHETVSDMIINNLKI